MEGGSWGWVFGSERWTEWHRWEMGTQSCDTSPKDSWFGTSRGVSVSWLSSWRPDYTGRSFNLVNASLFIQIKQFQQKGAKKKLVMGRKKVLNLSLLH